MPYIISGSVGINCITGIADNVEFQVDSTRGAILIPRMSTSEKNLLTGVSGMILYDNTLNNFQGYEDGAWVSLTASGLVEFDDLDTDLVGSALISASAVDWDTAMQFTKDLTGSTTLTFSNLRVNKTITLTISGDESLTLPAYVDIISGTYATASPNLIVLYCAGATSGSEIVWGTINQEG